MCVYCCGKQNLYRYTSTPTHHVGHHVRLCWCVAVWPGVN